MKRKTTIEKKLFVEVTAGYSVGCFSLNVTTAASTYIMHKGDKALGNRLQKIITPNILVVEIIFDPILTILNQVRLNWEKHICFG